VTITDAALAGETTVVFAELLTDGPGRCPGCGLVGAYRDRVERRVTDVPVAGHPLVLRVRVPRYRCVHALRPRGVLPRHQPARETMWRSCSRSTVQAPRRTTRPRWRTAARDGRGTSAPTPTRSSLALAASISADPISVSAVFRTGPVGGVPVVAAHRGVGLVAQVLGQVHLRSNSYVPRAWSASSTNLAVAGSL
jgi:transposase IS204/IS1001/IS1096/IS1165 family protein